MPSFAYVLHTLSKGPESNAFYLLEWRIEGFEIYYLHLASRLLVVW